MMIVRIRVYDGKDRPVGEFEVPVANVQAWLNRLEDQDSEALHDIREIVDPELEQENYSWDVWAKPAEVKADLQAGSGDGLLAIQ